MNGTYCKINFVFFALFAVIFVTFSPLLAEDFGPQPQAPVSFEHANALYRDGDFQKAALAYEDLLKKNNNTVIMYNLGNAWFRCWQESAGQSDEAYLGKAILAWEKVVRADPRHGDAQANLEYARNFVQDKFDFSEDSNAVWEALALLWNFPSVTEVESAFLILLWIVSLLFVVRRRVSGAFAVEATFWLLFLTIPLTLFLGLWSYSRAHDYETTREAIILARKTEVTSAPTLDEKMLFALHEGVKVRLLKASSGWCKIVIPNGSPGWVRQEHLGFISKPPGSSL